MGRIFGRIRSLELFHVEELRLRKEARIGKADQIIDSSGNREIIKVTHRNNGSNTFSVIERGADGTVARSFSTNDAVELRIPSIVLEEYSDDIATNVADIATNVADIVTLAARVTVNETDLAGTSNSATIPGPSGLKLYFYEDTAPATWTIDSGPADSLLAVKGGAQAYNVAGQQTAGSWTPTDHTHTGPAHVHTMNGHVHTGPSHVHTMNTHVHTTAAYTLLTSQIPSHTHNVRIEGTQAQGGGPRGYGVLTGGASYNAGVAAGGGGSHTHGNSGATDPGDTNASGTANTGSTDPGDTNSSGTAATGASASPSTDRPKAAVGIIATKD